MKSTANIEFIRKITAVLEINNIFCITYINTKYLSVILNCVKPKGRAYYILLSVCNKEILKYL